MSQPLKAVAGVVDAEVSFGDKSAKVEYDPEIVKPKQLVEAANATGFEARLSDEDSRETGTPGSSNESARSK